MACGRELLYVPRGLFESLKVIINFRWFFSLKLNLTGYYWIGTIKNGNNPFDSFTSFKTFFSGIADASNF